jgi:hypothetical protein
MPTVASQSCVSVAARRFATLPAFLMTVTCFAPALMKPTPALS